MNVLSMCASKNESLTKEFIEWYNKYYSKYMDIKSFAKLPSDFQVSIIEHFLESKNINFLTDLFNVHIYYVLPYLNKDEIMKIYNETGEFTSVLKKIHLEQPFSSILNANIYAIDYIFSHVLNKNF